MQTESSLFPDLPDQKAPEPILRSGVEPVWTEHKAQLIALYLRYFVYITKHGCYIDGFAGKKNADLPNSWAAELVIDSTPKFLKQFFLCDMDANKIADLEALVYRQPARPKRYFEVANVDFNDHVDAILASEVITNKVATFCLLDQFSVECHWATLRKLAEHKTDDANKIELFYFLGTGWMGRTLAGFSANPDIPKKWWGNDNWESMMGLAGDKIAIRMSERFRDELGYAHVGAWPIYQKENGEGRVMFHMIHASDHPEAPKLMKRAYNQVLRVPETDKQLAIEFGVELGLKPKKTK